MPAGLFLFSVNAVVILDASDGSRILAKYYTAPHQALNGSKYLRNYIQTLSTLETMCLKYLFLNFPVHAAATLDNPYPDVKSQKTFESGLLEKTAKQTGDIILYDNRIVLYKNESDVMVYVVGSVDENEVLLYNVILAIRDSLHLLFK